MNIQIQTNYAIEKNGFYTQEIVLIIGIKKMYVAESEEYQSVDIDGVPVSFDSLTDYLTKEFGVDYYPAGTVAGLIKGYF